MPFVIANNVVTCYRGEDRITFTATPGMSVVFGYTDNGPGIGAYIVSPDFHERFGMKQDPNMRFMGVELNDKDGNLVLGVDVRGGTIIHTETGAALLPISEALSLIQAVHAINPLTIRHALYGVGELA